MMDISLIIVVIISVILNAVFLVRFFSHRLRNKAPQTTETSTPQVNRNDENLVEQNNKLKLQIDMLLAKNNNLSFKIEELNITIKELNSQKVYLADNITKIEKLQQEKDEICAMAAHDIKNPAGTIKNLVRLLDTYDLTTSEQKQIHESLISISSRIITLVEEVSNTVKNNNVSFSLNFSRFNINNLIDTVVNRYLGISRFKSILVKSNKDIKINESLMDHDKIEEAIENLLSNAIKYAPEGSNIEIKTYLENDNLVLEVIDDGYGLSEEEIQKAFLRGTTLSTNSVDGEDRSGLGLWIVKRIIDEHNGRVWVRSKKGHGSTFAFRIPYEQKQ